MTTLRGKDFIQNSAISRLFQVMAPIAIAFSQARAPSNDTMADFINNRIEQTQTVAAAPKSEKTIDLNLPNAFRANTEVTSEPKSQSTVRKFQSNVSYALVQQPEHSNVIIPVVPAWEANQRLKALTIS